MNNLSEEERLDFIQKYASMFYAAFVNYKETGVPPAVADGLTRMLTEYDKIRSLIESAGGPTVTREWVAKMVMEHFKPGKYTAEEDYRQSILVWSAIVHEILIAAGVQIEERRRS